MTVVSKFRILHIVSGILVAILVGMVVGTIGSAFAAINWGFEYQYVAGCIIGIVGFIIFLIYLLNPVQIVVTNEHILFRNLIFRTVLRVKYDEIKNTNRDFSVKGSNLTSYRSQTTSTYTREIKLKNGKRIFFDDNIYKNFKEIDKSLLENIEKCKNCITS
jgi:hypothetical protein